MKLLIILILFFTSCGSQTTYRPTIYGHDYKYGEIIKPVTHERISCRDEEFNRYASVSLKDLGKLALVLKNAELPAHIRIIIEQFDNEVKKIRKSQGLRPDNKPKR